jgi:hypothetical protein
MQTHPGFYHYPTLSPMTGQVLFVPVDPASDRATSVLSRYLNTSYRLITHQAEELSRVRKALAAAAQSPPPPVFSPMYVPPIPLSLASEVPSSSLGQPGTSSGTRCESPAEWASLLATPAALMLRRRSSSLIEVEPSRQRRRVSFVPEDVIHIISSESKVEADDEESSVCECPCHLHHMSTAV